MISSCRNSRRTGRRDSWAGQDVTVLWRSVFELSGLKHTRGHSLANRGPSNDPTDLDSEKAESRGPLLERGPILAIVDTSGSMHGLPEQIAKAHVLEALRTANTEKRRCCLHASGAPDRPWSKRSICLPKGKAGSLSFSDRRLAAEVIRRKPLSETCDRFRIMLGRRPTCYS